LSHFLHTSLGNYGHESNALNISVRPALARAKQQGKDLVALKRPRMSSAQIIAKHQVGTTITQLARLVPRLREFERLSFQQQKMTCFLAVRFLPAVFSLQFILPNSADGNPSCNPCSSAFFFGLGKGLLQTNHRPIHACDRINFALIDIPTLFHHTPIMHRGNEFTLQADMFP
jgi:hypothetical protein